MAVLRSSTGQCLQGDGAGVGKGRQIAALFKDHFRKSGGRNTRGLWVSVRPPMGLLMITWHVGMQSVTRT